MTPELSGDDWADFMANPPSGDQPAFPATFPYAVAQGLTKREWFAGMALTGCIAGVIGEAGGDDDVAEMMAKAAAWAEMAADAMFAERAKRGAS